MLFKDYLRHIVRLFMIRQGSKGSITFFFKGKLISSFPLTEKKTLERYLYHGEHLIRESKGFNIKQQIKVYTVFCNKILRKKNNKEKINSEDHIYFMYCITALLRLRILDNDAENGYLCMPRKK